MKVDIEDLEVNVCSTCESRENRAKYIPKKQKTKGFEPPRKPTESEVVQEALRCLYCYNAPCSKGCPGSLDIKEFVHAASVKNWYYASKIIMNKNPMPLSTGLLCACQETCQAACNLARTIQGPIKTGMIQTFCVRKFKEYNIKPKVNNPENGKKVAIIGSGPAGLSCAVFLRRLGFTVTIFEKEAFAGGILMSQITPNRLPLEDLEFEIQMVKDYGVTFEFNKIYGKDITKESLKKDGYEAIFLAFGLPDTIKPNIECKGAITSKEFLESICGVLKFKNGKELPDYTHKKILVLGAGDSAMDCASAASRLGGNVTVAFRKDFKGMRANDLEFNKNLKEGVEFLPLVSPSKIEDGKVTFRLQENDNGTYKELDEYITRQYDQVILAFGAKLEDQNLLGKKSASNIQKVEGEENIFIGGDLSNSNSVIEAVNDGRTAAKLISEALGVKKEMPPFQTEVDDVSLATEFAGLKFINPIGPSSAPVTGNYECARNALRAGMGWVVIKTVMISKDINRENDFRIVKCEERPGAPGSFTNICMLTEHSEEYWIDAIKKLKKEFPDRIIVVSISTSDSKERWHKLVEDMQEAGADGLELNLSCPNEVHGEGGNEGGFNSENKIGMALGTLPSSVKRITQFVKEKAKIPFFVKLTPNITEPLDIARAAIEGGATGVSMINTVSGIAKFYPDGTPLPQVGKEKYVLSGGCSGDMIRPVALRQIARVHNDNPKIPILAIGGIGSGYTALQHLYAGGSAFQICSAFQRYSFEICREMLSGLQFFLYSWSRPDLRAMLSFYSDEMNSLPLRNPIPKDSKPDRPVPKLSELRGLGAKYVVEREKFDLEWTIHAEIDDNICLRCGKCAQSCRDNSENCIRFVDGKWQVDPNECVGCGLCVSVCPINAMKLVESAQRKKLHHQDLNDLREEEAKKKK